MMRILLISCCTLWGLAQPSSTQVAVQWPGSCKSTEVADDAIAGIDLTGKVMIVSGADGNIAGEVSLSLARSKASLILACRKSDKCEAVKKKISDKLGKGLVGTLEVELIDLSSKASIADFAKRVMQRHPKIDALINSAGLYMTRMTHDNLVMAMEVNLLGPALLTNLLLPALRGDSTHAKGRVVNVAAATYGTEQLLKENYTTVADLSAICTKLDAKLNATGGYFPLSKLLMTHHAIELAWREPAVAAFAVNPGVAVLAAGFPNWIKKQIHHIPNWLKKNLPAEVQRIIEACNTNEIGWEACPQTYAQAASVIAAAAAWKDIESFSGSFLDFDTTLLAPNSSNVYGPFEQQEPTCVPRTPPPMNVGLRSKWFDEMLLLMGSDSTTELIV